MYLRSFGKAFPKMIHIFELESKSTIITARWSRPGSRAGCPRRRVRHRVVPKRKRARPFPQTDHRNSGSLVTIRAHFPLSDRMMVSRSGTGCRRPPRAARSSEGFLGAMRGSACVLGFAWKALRNGVGPLGPGAPIGPIVAKQRLSRRPGDGRTVHH